MRKLVIKISTWLLRIVGFRSLISYEKGILMIIPKDEKRHNYTITTDAKAYIDGKEVDMFDVKIFKSNQ